jgi:hypothetical protein
MGFSSAGFHHNVAVTAWFRAGLPVFVVAPRPSEQGVDFRKNESNPGRAVPQAGAAGRDRSRPKAV